MRVYVAGPMSGLPDFNYPAFHAAAELLRQVGYKVENPAVSDRPTTDPWELFMRDAIARLATCDGVAQLPGHHTSRGARIETRIAHDLGMTVKPLKEWLT